MRWMVATALTGTLLAARGLGAQAGPERATGGADFTPMAFLAGNCWVGTFPDGKLTDEHCFEWLYDGRWLRDRHVVRGGKPYAGETTYGWDGAAQRLGFWYFNSDGVLTTGHVQYAGDSIVFPERYTTERGEVELRSVWARAGADAYRVTTSRRETDGWRVLWTMEMRRRR